MEFKHVSVLLEETLDGLNIKPDGLYMDGTLGGGGHSFHIAERLTSGHLYGIDQDADAIKAASERLACYGDKVTIIRDNYVNGVARLKEIGVTGLDGIMLDLGVSSYQLDTAERGFTYKEDAPLDMRMDNRQSLTAKEIVNTYSETELFRIIRDYGEDNFAKNIAKHICIARQDKEIETTFELNEIIKAAIPAKIRAKGGHPSKRTFQAIRIECNKELDVLKNSIEEMVDFLESWRKTWNHNIPVTRDRIVKKAFASLQNPCTCPPNIPMCMWQEIKRKLC